MLGRIGERCAKAIKLGLAYHPCPRCYMAGVFVRVQMDNDEFAAALRNNQEKMERALAYLRTRYESLP